MPGEPACAACARPFPEGGGGDATCASCRAEPPCHDGIAAATIYNDASRKLVLAFKHGNRIALAPMMARLMAARLSQVGDGWLFVPVPLHRWRLWRRGYNQAALLARELVRIRGGALLVDGLVRRKSTPMLGGLGRGARARALGGAICANPARVQQLRGADIVLVDDVLTSGATSDACVMALRNAGARKVIVTCFARVLDDLEQR